MKYVNNAYRQTEDSDSTTFLAFIDRGSLSGLEAKCDSHYDLETKFFLGIPYVRTGQFTR